MSKEPPKPYLLEDDRRIVAAVNAAKREGRPLPTAFEEMAQELGRTKIAINYRYYNVLKPKIERGEFQLGEKPAGDREGVQSEEQTEFEFVPYIAEDNRRLRQYSAEDDERIMELVRIAEEEEIPLPSIYSKLADELDRSAKAIEVRINILKRRKKNELTEDDEDDDGGEGGNIVSKLRTLVKERDHYKKLYETSEEKLKDYDRMQKEYRKIKRLIDNF